jgi:hypothetical protein
VLKNIIFYPFVTAENLERIDVVFISKHLLRIEMCGKGVAHGGSTRFGHYPMDFDDSRKSCVRAEISGEGGFSVSER